MSNTEDQAILVKAFNAFVDSITLPYREQIIALKEKNRQMRKELLNYVGEREMLKNMTLNAEIVEQQKTGDSNG